MSSARLSVWLQGKVRKDVSSVSERNENDSTALLTQRNSGTESFVPQHRYVTFFDWIYTNIKAKLTNQRKTKWFLFLSRSVRVKRTEPAYTVKRIERAGCNLATCSVHELAHLLNIMHTKTSNAPSEKIGSGGYGRRRRRSFPSKHPALNFHEGRLKLAWVQTIDKGI